MAGGLAGTALLMQGTAHAETTVATSTSITGTTQLLVDPGIPPVLQVNVSVGAQSGSSAPNGGVQVSTQTSDGTVYKCTANLSSSSGATSTGNCQLRNMPFGSYALHAAYTGTSTYATSNSKEFDAAVGTMPSFTANSPSNHADKRGYYSYTFAAKGVPQPTFKLVNAPDWLNVNATTGQVYGWLPWTVTNFSYSVTASNAVGSVTSGPFNVTTGVPSNSKIATSVSCPRFVVAGQGGHCTLYVSNTGSSLATGVNASLQLPRLLQARWCGIAWGWSWGRGPSCSLNHSTNTASWHIGRLWPGQTKAFVVYFSAHHFFWNGSTTKVTVTGDATWNTRNDMGGGPVAITYSSAKVLVYQRGWWR